MDDSTKQLMTELSGVDAVYRDENFDSLSQVMRLLAHSTPEAAREELDAQLQIANSVFDRLVDEHHEQVLENAVRHGQALDMYRDMSNGLRSLAVEVDEAKRSLRPVAADSLMQLRFKRAVLSDVTSMLESVAELQALPQVVQELLMRGSVVEATERVTKGMTLALGDDLIELAPLEPVRKQLINLTETCFAAIMSEIKRLIYGGDGSGGGGSGTGHSGPGRGQGDGSQQRTLLSALDSLQLFGADMILRARAELAASLRPELVACCERLDLRHAAAGSGRAVGGRVGHVGVAARVQRLLNMFEHLRHVLQMHLYVSLTLGDFQPGGDGDGDIGRDGQGGLRRSQGKETGDGALAGRYEMTHVWEAVQQLVLDQLEQLLGTSLMQWWPGAVGAGQVDKTKSVRFRRRKAWGGDATLNGRTASGVEGTNISFSLSDARGCIQRNGLLVQLGHGQDAGGGREGGPNGPAGPESRGDTGLLPDQLLAGLGLGVTSGIDAGQASTSLAACKAPGGSSTSSCYLLLALDARVRLFVEEAEGLCVCGVGMGEGDSGEMGDEDVGKSAEKKQGLRMCLDGYTTEVLLPRIERDYTERMRGIIHGAEAWTKVASSSAGLPGRDASMPVLESALAADALLQELLGMIAALPGHAAALGKMWSSILGIYAAAAASAVDAVSLGSRVQYIVDSSGVRGGAGGDDLLAVLKTDPILVASEQAAKDGVPQLQRVTKEEVEAFYCVEALRVDPVLLAVVRRGRGGDAPAGAAMDEGDWGPERVLDAEIPQLACLHHSVSWLRGRLVSRRQDLFTTGATCLPALQGTGLNVQGRGGGGDVGAGLQLSHTVLVGDVLRCGAVDGDTGACSLAAEPMAAVWMEVEGAEASVQSAALAALLTARLLVRWQVAVHVSLLVTACLSPRAAAGGEPQRLCETLKKMLERWDFSLRSTLPPHRAAVVFAYVPMHTLAVTSDAVELAVQAAGGCSGGDGARGLDDDSFAVLENALATVFHYLPNLAGLQPVLHALALREQLLRMLEKLRCSGGCGENGLMREGAAETCAQQILHDNYTGLSV